MWTDRLLAIVGPVLDGTPLLETAPETDPALADARTWVESFRDGAGSKRPVDHETLCHLLGLPPDDDTQLEDPHLDLALWRAIRTGSSSHVDPLRPSSGPLIDPDGWVIEVWTETELSALQALHTIAIERADANLRERALVAARWHLRETQPDNATNRPWALAAFVDLASQPDVSAEAELYAQTLLHNALMPAGQPEPLSACILLQAARVLGQISG